MAEVRREGEVRGKSREVRQDGENGEGVAEQKRSRANAREAGGKESGQMKTKGHRRQRDRDRDDRFRESINDL